MTDKELKRLSRGELLELLIAQMEENEKLKVELKKAKKRAASRKIAIEQAGSIAEAALALNGVFEAAEAAAAQYLENVRQMSGDQETLCRQMEENAVAEAQTICAEADTYHQTVHAEADEYSQTVRAEADAYSQTVRAEADDYSRRMRQEAELYQMRAAEKIAEMLPEKESTGSPSRPMEEGGTA